MSPYFRTFLIVVACAASLLVGHKLARAAGPVIEVQNVPILMADDLGNYGLGTVSVAAHGKVLLCMSRFPPAKTITCYRKIETTPDGIVLVERFEAATTSTSET